MSILIRGMQKPNYCGICPFERDGFPDEWEMHCKLLGRQVGYFDKKNKVPKDCPIIEVATPHGRLIDADVFDRHMKQTPRYFSMCCDLEEQPTIIEAEEEP